MENRRKISRGLGYQVRLPVFWSVILAWSSLTFLATMVARGAPTVNDDDVLA